MRKVKRNFLNTVRCVLHQLTTSLILWYLLSAIFFYLTTVECLSLSSNDVFYFEIIENSKPATFVGKIRTKEGFTYRFSDEPLEFNIDHLTGAIITTSTPLDRETKDFYNLVILSSSPTYLTEVKIKILDVNDNAPYWPSYINRNVSFSESAPIGTKLIIDTAVDLDEGNLSYELVPVERRKSINGLTRYNKYLDNTYNYDTIETTLPFRLSYNISSSFLNLEVSDYLDRETQSNYIVNISASDEGGLKAFLVLYVQILDVNDNPPIFDHSDYSVSLNESVGKGVSILQVRATDADEEENENSFISYYLLSDEFFTIDSITGIIYTAQEGAIDCGTPSTNSGYKVCVFTVFAHDHGTPRQNGRAYVTVNLLDTNDHDPQIKFRYLSRSDHATVDENSTNGSVVTAVSVVDLDHGPNGETSLKIVDGNEFGHFRLESISDSHIIRVNGSLDREKVSRYNLTIIAKDHGIPPRSSTANLIIYVNDVNDHEPVFNRELYEVNLVESLPVGSFVVSVTAVDLDEGINSNLYYSLSGENAHYFKIDTITGLVTTEKIINREENQSFELKATARDGGPNPKWAYSTLKINVLDINDQVPLLVLPNDLKYDNLSKSYILEVLENTKVNLDLTTVDKDLGANGTVDCSLLHNYDSLFRIQDTLDSQKLVSTRELDYEQCGEYKLSIITKDRGLPHHQLSSTTTLLIHVLDKDDQLPSIYPNTYFAFIPYNFTLLNYSIVVSRALLRDGDSMSPVSFKMEPNGQSSVLNKLLLLNPRTGEINLRMGRRLIDKNMPSVLNFNVTCSPCTGTANRALFIIYVIQSNSRKNIESINSEYEFEISEAVDIGTIIGKIDIDITKLRLTIVSGDPFNQFKIDRIYIRTNKVLDREKISNYKLQLVAYNSQAFVHVDVKINLIDVNDNQPLFSEKFIELIVPVDVPPKLTIYRLKANDPDLVGTKVSGNHSSSHIRYHLLSNPDHLVTIDNDELKINKSLIDIYSYRLGHRTNDIINMIDIVAIEVVATDPSAHSSTPSYSVCGLTNRLIIYLHIKNVNKHKPRFISSFYEISLSESVPVNTQFFTLSAIDEDGDKIQYAIKNGSISDSFGIFPDGNLFVKRQLDRELLDVYSLEIVAFESEIESKDKLTNGKHHHRHNWHDINSKLIDRQIYCQVIIHIVDENDNAPIFTNSTFTFKIEENSDQNTLIGQIVATDADKEANSEIHYSILASNYSSMVEIDPYSGHLWSKIAFDSESLSKLELEVIAYDQSYDSLRFTSTATIVIDITDVNDNAPRFTIYEDGIIFMSEWKNEYVIYTISISEDIPVPSKVITVKASDPDKTSKIKYKIVDSSRGSYFSINSSTGELWVSHALDRELINLLEVLISADDDYFESYMLLRFMLEDVNDNAPRFVNFTLNEITVAEDTPIGTSIISFNAIDPDIENNGQFKFEIGQLSSPYKNKIFDLKGNNLIVSKPLDYESSKIHYLNISAVDNGGLKSEIKLLKIIVTDANDCTPVFSNNQMMDVIKVSENIDIGSKLTTVQAVDCDEGDILLYSIITCDIYKDTKKKSIKGSFTYYNTLGSTKLENNCPLSVNPQTADLFTISRLDRETMETIQVTIKVIDNNGHSNKKQVTIILDDVNDNYPVFTSPNAIILFKSAIDENEFIATIEAYDGDAGINSLITYKLDSDSSDLFALDSTSGQLIAKKSLNYDIVEDIKVLALDGAGLVTSDIIHFKLMVSSTEKYDDELRLEVYENEPIGVRLHKFKCNNGGCEFFITSGKDRTLSVDRITGDLVVKGILDRENNDEYDIKVVTIRGLEPHITKVNLRVLDRNDNPPIINSINSGILVSEGTPIGSEIFDISAITKDEDETSKLEYKLINCSLCLENIFLVDSLSGKIILKESLDREYIAFYELVIGVSDSIHLSTTKINIVVTDINDNAPKFNQAYYSFEVAENTERGVVVGKIEAIDLDEYSQSLISYSIVLEGPSEESIFSLNEKSGEFTLTRHLDYENDPNHFIIVIEAFDGTFKSEQVNVYFNLINLNDNLPVFDPVSYKVEILENSTIGIQILCISATDSDFYQYYDGSEKNDTKIKYYFQLSKESSFKNEKSSLVQGFKINEDTGCIHLVESLDREKISSYDLNVIADDGFFKSSANLHIKVKDVNDNEPLFDIRTPSILYVSENLGPDSIVYNFKAYDLDEMPNNYIQYKLHNDAKNLYNQNFPFSIGSIDGVLRLTGKLDREVIDIYHLLVRAEDYGYKSNEVKMIVEVTDINDNSPQFEQSEYRLSVPENVDIDTRILKLKATDLDKPDKIVFRIISGDIYGHFKIIDDELVVVIALDYEKISSYNLRVQAIDKGGNVDIAQVIIKIINVHDEAPSFQNSPYFLNWCENEVGLIGEFTAIGEVLDESKNDNRLNYLLKNNNKQYFELNSTNALLSIIRPIDREALGDNPVIELRIIAIDKRMPRLTGEGIIFINIIDVNDNWPSFSKSEYTFSLVENKVHYAKYSFGKVEAIDVDSSNEISFELEENELKNVFTIDKKDGTLSLYNDVIFDRELKSEYHFVVVAKDAKYEARTKVKIKISDVNDCKPLFRAINGQTLDGSLLTSRSIKVDTQIVKAWADDLFVIGLHVSDCDEENTLNSKVKFDLQDNKESTSLFYIDSNTGVIRCHRLPDLNSTHLLKVTASDMSSTDSLSNTLTIEITFYLASDWRHKRLVDAVHKILVSELVRVNKIVHSFSLLSQLSGDVVFEILGGDPYQNFRIDRKYLRVNKALDYENIQKYNLFIQAMRKANDGSVEFEMIKIQVEVINENDNAPKFDFDAYNASIIEEVEESVMVIQLSASDVDFGDENSDSSLSYKILSPIGAPFRIDVNYGTIWTTEKVDREVKSEYNLIVSVEDEGGLSSLCSVKVNVEDKNDNPPRFTRLFSVNITENAPIGTLVIQVTSSDKDDDIFSKAIYSFVEVSDTFEIEAHTGKVYVIGTLDREIKEEYLLIVSANDGSWKAQTTLTINILDENDNAPIFEKNFYEFKFKVLNETIIGSVKANDLDKGLNSVISYSFKHNSDYFSIDSLNGEIYLKSAARTKLTYNEDLQFLNIHNLTVIASDRGLISKSSEVTLILTLLPNIQATQHDQIKILKIPVPYNLKNGTLITDFKHQYIIRGNIGRIIEQKNSQIIFTGEGLVKKGEEYNFKFDSTNQEIHLIIIIINSNNHPPVFIGTQSQVVVGENEDTNDILFQIKATDNDKDQYNNEINYQLKVVKWTWNEKSMNYYQKILKPNIEGVDFFLVNLSLIHLLNTTNNTRAILHPFRIDPINGMIYLNSSLDYELITGYRLEIIATDRALFNSKNSSIFVNVHVTDINDNPPLFENITNDSIIFEVNENNIIGEAIGKVKATDFDSLRYSQISYEILHEPDQQYFSIGKKNGEIKALISFDYEQKREYHFQVIAKNDKKVQTVATVIIKVKNLNEFKPRFKSKEFIFDIFKSTPLNSVIGSLYDAASDEDYKEPIYYYMIKNRKFGAELERNGTLRLKKNIDFEENDIKETVFIVIAKNAGPIKNSGDYDEAKIIFNLEGINKISNRNQSNFTCLLGTNSICKDEKKRNSPDPMSIGIILVILFFVILILVISTSFIIFHNQKKKSGRNSNAVTRKVNVKHHLGHQINGSSQSSTLLHASLHNSSLSSQPGPPPLPPLNKQRPPDVIESPSLPPVTQRAPPAPPPTCITPYSDGYSDVIPGPYDLENASSITPSDIDLVYRYKDFRGRESNVSSHKHVPLARLSPSVSELTAPRILTLHDLSPVNINPINVSCSVANSPPNMAPLPPPNKLQHINGTKINGIEERRSDDSFACSEFNGNFKMKKGKNLMFQRIW